MSHPSSPAATPPAAESTQPLLSFRRLDAAGHELPAGVTDGHVITHYPRLGLMFDVRAPRAVKSLAQAQAVAAECDLLGRRGEWALPDRFELQALIDPAFCDPAVNPAAAPAMPENGGIYTSSKAAWSSDLVWFVGLGYGGVFWYRVDTLGLVVPVLRCPPSQ